MSGVNRNPPSDEGALEQIRRSRVARLVSARVNRMIADAEEQQLEELDDAIVGTNHDELRALRAQLEPSSRNARAGP